MKEKYGRKENISYICARKPQAAIAQLVERFTRNEEVPSSSLGCGSKSVGCRPYNYGRFFYCILSNTESISAMFLFVAACLHSYFFHNHLSTIKEVKYEQEKTNRREWTPSF